MEATRAYRDTCECAFSAVMGMNVSINGHVSCLLMYEQFCLVAENNFHLFWMRIRRDAHCIYVYVKAVWALKVYIFLT